MGILPVGNFQYLVQFRHRRIFVVTHVETLPPDNSPTKYLLVIFDVLIVCQKTDCFFLTAMGYFLTSLLDPISELLESDARPRTSNSALFLPNSPQSSPNTRANQKEIGNPLLIRWWWWGVFFDI